MEKPERKWNSDCDRRAAGSKSAERFVCVSVYALFETLLEPYEASLC